MINKNISIGIVILTWNEVSNTIQCLKATLKAVKKAHVKARIILVDNGSEYKVSEELNDKIKAEDIEVEVIKSPENIGFGAGMAFGIGELQKNDCVDYFWLLNNDTLPMDDSLVSLSEYVLENLSKNVIGSTIIDFSSRNIQCAGGCKYNSWLSMEKAFLKNKPISDLVDWQEKDVSLDYVFGAAMLVRADFYNKIGGFCKDYFLYFEELHLASYCNKNELGWCKGALVLHQGGGTSSSSAAVDAFCTYHAALSGFRFTLLQYPLRLPSVMLARLVGKALHSIYKKDPVFFKAVSLAALDFIIGKTRKTPQGFVVK